jgi:hypothetical protein
MLSMRGYTDGLHVEYTRIYRRTSCWVCEDIQTDFMLSMRGYTDGLHVEYERIYRRTSCWVYEDIQTDFILSMRGYTDGLYVEYERIYRRTSCWVCEDIQTDFMSSWDYYRLLFCGFKTEFKFLSRVLCNDKYYLRSKAYEPTAKLDNITIVNVEPLTLSTPVKIQVILRLTFSRPVCLGIGHPSGTHDQIFIIVEHSRSSYYRAPSLTKGWVYNLLSQFAVYLGFKSRRTHYHILQSHLRLPPTRRVRPTYLYPPGTGWPSYTPRHWVLLQGSTRGLNTTHYGTSQSQSYIMTDGQSASLSCCRASIWDPPPIFLFLLIIIFRQLRRPLWREVWLVVFSFCWALPAQPFWDLSLTGLMSILYFLYFWDSLNLDGQVPVFVSPRNRVAQLYRGHWVTTIHHISPEW